MGAAATLIGATPSPVGAADAGSVASGELDWAFSEYVRTQGSLTPNQGAVAPAVNGDESWTFPTLSSGTYDPETGATELRFDGGLFVGNVNRGNYGLRLTDVQVHVDEEGSGRLQADVATRGPGMPGLETPWEIPTEDVTVVSFSLSDVSDDGSTVAWEVTPDYPLQADEGTREEPTFEGARQFPDTLLSLMNSGLWNHFSDSLSDGSPNPDNPKKAPAPLTVYFEYVTDTGSTSSSTSSSTTSSSTSSTTSTTASTTTTTTIAPPDDAPEPSGTATATGPEGQTMSVTPAENLDPNGTTVTVTGSGFDPEVGIYVGFCVDKGATTAPTPCSGGADQEGDGGSSAWISSNPPPYAVGLTTPFGAGGSFEVTIDVAATFGDADCFDESTSCVIATRADHTNGQNRSADVKVPVTFVGQTPIDDGNDDGQDQADDGDDDTAPSVRIVTTDARVGGPIVVEGSGFLAGEQVQVILHSDPVVLGVAIADADGALSASMVIPVDTPVGTHHIELLGVTSGISATSPLFNVSAAVTDGGGGTGGGALARTGGEPVGLMVFGGLAIIAGAALVGSSAVVRRR